MIDLDQNQQAILSEDGQYRYWLRRDLSEPLDDEPERRCLFIMLNPSTADATEDDATIRRCMHFAKREGANVLGVVNLFAYRSTNPTKLKVAKDPVGIHNDAVIASAKDWALCKPNSLIICAWGNHGAYLERSGRVLGSFKRHHKRTTMCFKLTSLLQPVHPLYQPNDAPLIPIFNARFEYPRFKK